MTHLLSPDCPSVPTTAGSRSMQSNGCNECRVVLTNIMCSTWIMTPNTRSARSAFPGFREYQYKPHATGSSTATGDTKRTIQLASKLMSTEHCGEIIPQISKLIIAPNAIKNSVIGPGHGMFTPIIRPWI